MIIIFFSFFVLLLFFHALRPFQSERPGRGSAHVLIAYYISFILMSFSLTLSLSWGDVVVGLCDMSRHVHLSKLKPRSARSAVELQIRSIKRVNRKCRDARLGAAKLLENEKKGYWGIDHTRSHIRTDKHTCVPEYIYSYVAMPEQRLHSEIQLLLLYGISEINKTFPLIFHI